MGPRERGQWKACHELVRLESEAAWRCKHCQARFTDEAVQHAPLPICPGPGAHDE